MGIQRLTAADFGSRDREKSIAFILGCGSSINLITDEQYEVIGKNLSIGINQFFKNNRFSPDLLCLEGARPKEIKDLKEGHNPSDPWLEIQERYRSEVPPKLLIKDLHQLKFDNSIFSISSWQPNTKSIFTPPMALKSKDDLRSAIRQHWTISNYFRFDLIFGIRGTLAFLIWLLAKAGYRKIVIMGVDLKGPYFFEDSDKIDHQIHPTLIEDKIEITIVDFLHCFAEFAESELDVIINKSFCSDVIDLPEFNWRKEVSTSAMKSS